MTDAVSEQTGPYGTAQQLPIPEGHKSAQTVDHWLITAPWFHPLWSQYMLAGVRLDDIEGFPPPVRKFAGATHEVLVVALLPEYGPHTVESILVPPLPYLTPVNISIQFNGTDEEMRELLRMAAYGITVGALNPETSDAPEAIRLAWMASLTKTLQHIRGEAHDA